MNNNKTAETRSTVHTHTHTHTVSLLKKKIGGDE